MRFLAASATGQVPLFHAILNAQPTLGTLDDLTDVCAHLAERYLGGAGRTAERLTFSAEPGEYPVALDFSDILDLPLTPEARGRAVLVHLAKLLVPALRRQGADEQAALCGAMQITAQLGEREFATLEQRAVQNATAGRMFGAPVSATHIVLKAHGEVLLHKSTQWAGYVDDAGQTIGFSADGPAILSIDWVGAFRFERTDRATSTAADGVRGARAIWANADGRKRFALHGQVQRCLLDTPDARLKAMLTCSPATFYDLLLYGFARFSGWAGIFIEPPAPRCDRLWESTRPAPHAHPQAGQQRVPQAPRHILQGTARRVQAFHAGIQERNAACALGAYCQAAASQLVSRSDTKAQAAAERAQGARRAALLAQVECYGAEVAAIRSKQRVARYPAVGYANLLADVLKYSAGDCAEMAIVAAALVQSQAKPFLSERGFANAEVTAGIYEAKFNGDHMFCVMNLRINGFTFRIVIDPWLEVSMPYGQYVDYVTTNATSGYIRADTTFGLYEWLSKVVNQEYFVKQAAGIIKKYWTGPRRPY